MPPKCIKVAKMIVIVAKFSDIEDDHLLNATYYSPEAEERHLLEHSSTNLGMMVHNESPTHMDAASSAGKNHRLVNMVHNESPTQMDAASSAGTNHRLVMGRVQLLSTRVRVILVSPNPDSNLF